VNNKKKKERSMYDVLIKQSTHSSASLKDNEWNSTKTKKKERKYESTEIQKSKSFIYVRD
jgi:hypothetical protein